MKTLQTFAPEKALAACWRKLSAATKTAFFTALAAGFLTHIVFFIQTHINEDSILAFRKTSADVASARWFNNILNDLRLQYSPPFFIGLLTILFVALAAALICYILTIRRRGTAAVAALLIVTFPVTAYTAGYLYAVDGYMLAFLLATAAAACAKRWTYGFLPGAACFALALAIYQSYLTVAASLALFALALECVKPNAALRPVALKAARYLAMGVLGYAAYYATVQISLGVAGTALTGYRGIDTMGTVDFSGLFSNISTIYYRVYNAYRGAAYPLTTWAKALILASLLLTALFLALRCVKHKLYKRPLLFLIGVALLALSPVAVFTLPILMPGATLNMLVMYSFILPFVFIAALAEDVQEDVFPLLRSAALAILLLFSGYHFMVTQVYYLKLETFQTRSAALYNRILARAEPLLQHAPERRVAVVGHMPTYYYPEATHMFKEFSADQGVWGQFIGLNSYGYWDNTNKFIRYADNLLGVKLGYPSPDDIERAMATSPDRPIWPEEGSVFVDSGVIVINLGHPVIDTDPGPDGVYRFTLHPPLPEMDGYIFSWRLEKNGAPYRMINNNPPTSLTAEFDLSEPGRYRVLCEYGRPYEKGVTARTGYIEIG